MSIKTFFASLGALFGSQKPSTQVAEIASDKNAIIQIKRRSNKYPWLDREMKNITGAGHYIIMVPASIDANHAQSLICGRLHSYLGESAGRWTTRSVSGTNAIRVIVH